MHFLNTAIKKFAKKPNCIGIHTAHHSTGYCDRNFQEKKTIIRRQYTTKQAVNLLVQIYM